MLNNNQKFAILNQGMCKNLLHLNCRTLTAYFERSEIHLPTEKHLSSSRRHDNNLLSFSPWYCKLAVHVYIIVFVNDTFHVQLAVKCILWWKLCLFKIPQAIHILKWIKKLEPHKLNNFVSFVKRSKVHTLTIVQIRS